MWVNSVEGVTLIFARRRSLWWELQQNELAQSRFETWRERPIDLAAAVGEALEKLIIASWFTSVLLETSDVVLTSDGCFSRAYRPPLCSTNSFFCRFSERSGNPCAITRVMGTRGFC